MYVSPQATTRPLSVGQTSGSTLITLRSRLFLKTNPSSLCAITCIAWGYVSTACSQYNAVISITITVAVPSTITAHLEIRAGVGSGVVCLPVVITQVTRARQKSFFAREIWLRDSIKYREYILVRGWGLVYVCVICACLIIHLILANLKVLHFESVRVIYVPRNFLPFMIFSSEENNGSQLAVAHKLLALTERFEKWRFRQVFPFAAKPFGPFDLSADNRGEWGNVT